MAISYSGYRNGFPFKIEHVTGADEAAAGVGSNTNYPVGMSFYHAAEIYWRWRIIESVISLELDNDGTPETYDYTINHKRSFWNGLEDLIPSYESQLVSKAAWNLTIDDVATYPDVLYCFHDYPQGSTIPRVKFYNGLYYPQFGFYEASAIYYYSTIVGDTPGVSTHVMDLTMQDGTVYNFDMFYLPSSETVTVVSFTLDISAAQYWGYSGKFNTTTGAYI